MAATGRITAAAIRSSTAKGRLTAAQATATASTVGRITSAALVATAAARGRLSAASGVATIGPTVAIPATVGNLEPGVPVAVIPLVTGATASAITWTSDRAGQTFSQVGGTLRYKPPATLTGVAITWTVTVTTTTGATLTASTVHTVLPHAGGWKAAAAGPLYPVLVGTPTLAQLAAGDVPITAPSSSFPISDAFTGGPSSSAPAGWSLVSSTGSVGVDSSGRMLLTTPAASGPVLVSWTKMTPTADVELTGDVTFSTLGAQYATASLRASTPKTDNFPNDGYSFELNPSAGWYLFKLSGGARATVANGAFASYAAGVPVKFRFVISGANVRFRIWTGATEPTTWQYDGVDYLVTAPGTLMLGSYTGTNGTAATSAWDNISVQVPTSTVTVPPATGSGVAMPTTSGGAKWAYSYGQDFNTDAALGSFGSAAPYVGWAGFDGALDTQDWGHYRPAKSLWVSNSQLHLRQFYDAATSDFIGACPFPKPPAGVNGGSQEYLGMAWTVRWRRNGSGNGFKVAWMLYGQSFSWPDGEIDFPEMDQSDSQVHGFSHRAGYTNTEAQQNTLAVSGALPMNTWHTARTEWIPKGTPSLPSGSVEFFLDGVSLGKTFTDVPSKPMHVQLQTETWLSSTRPDESADYTTDVDWFVVEQYVGG